jgi:hypothetical protein
MPIKTCLNFAKGGRLDGLAFNPRRYLSVCRLASLQLNQSALRWLNVKPSKNVTHRELLEQNYVI